MKTQEYLMEHEDESIRLEMKTDFDSLKNQAVWAGLKEGMRVADIGCGSGITSAFLKQIVGEKGFVTGIDNSLERILYARKKYETSGIEFIHRDIRELLDDFNTFDFIWVRFFLEYYKSESKDLVEKFSKILKPGGILCLIDLDYNCLSHYGMPSRLENAILRVSENVEQNNNFDPYAGRKLYSYLYDLGLKDLNVDIKGHHTIFGKLSDVDEFNWMKKIEIAACNSGYDFQEYPDGYNGFLYDFMTFFKNPRRFSYTPIIICRGVKDLYQ